MPPAGAQTTLTVSSWVPPSHHLTRVVLEGFIEEVEKASAGHLKFQMLPKHPVAASATFDAVRDGLVDISLITASYTPDRLLLPLVAEFPGAGKTAEITSVAYGRLHERYLRDAGEYKGVHLLAVFTHGPGQLFNTRRPIERLADLQGMKLRTGGSVAEAMARALGASVVVNPVNPNARTDNRELLTTGLADGVLFPQDAIVSFGLDGVMKYATLFPGGLFNFSFGFVMNQDKWDKLTKQDQELLARFGGEFFRAPRRQVLGQCRPPGKPKHEESRCALRHGESGVHRGSPGESAAPHPELDQRGEGKAQYGRRHAAAGIPR